jgi:Uma2 family endonuclease
MYATVLPPDDEPDVDQRVVLRDVPWEVYLAIADARGERATPRLTYADGVLELMSPSDHHERIKKTAARLLELWAAEREVDVVGLGSTTWRDAAAKIGLEADECYFVGAEREGFPDIALEVVWTGRAVDKLRLYARLGVPEVWVWHRGRLVVHALRAGTYEPIPRSALLPDVDLDLLSSLAAHPDQAHAVRAWRTFLRGTAR